MFEQNYKNAMDNITVDNDTHKEILDRIIKAEEKNDRKNLAIPWRVAFACVACVAIILGIVFVPHDDFKITVDNEATPQTLTITKSYNEIYNLIKPKESLRKKIKKVVTQNADISEDIAIDYEYEYSYETEESITDDEGSNINFNGADSATGVTKEESEDFSDTTEQVEGVSEADIVKTDGEYIYYIKGTTFAIFTADGENSKLVSRTELSTEYTRDYGDMFLKNDRVIIIQPEVWGKNSLLLIIYDVSDPASPKEIAVCTQDGYYNSSRMVGDYIYLVSNCHIDLSRAKRKDPKTFVPTTTINGVCEAVPADSIYRYEQEKYTNQYTVIGAFNYKDGTLSDTASLLGGTENIYCSKGNIILADTNYNDGDDVAVNTEYSPNYTIASRLAIANGQIEYKSTGKVDGVLENQFYIDEHNGYFRFVTTVTKAIKKEVAFENTDVEYVYIVEDIAIVDEITNNSSATLTVLDSELKQTGVITDLAKGERVYSVRFMGDTAYFVTFRQTDPLFSVDLSDPANPMVLGELKIPGFSEYMYPYGEGLLLGFGMDADEKTGRTKDIKLSMFNITDPANVTEQNKTIIEGYQYSPALYNHKAMLVSANKNLIGFAATDNYLNIRYMIYEYTGDNFIRRAALNVNANYEYAMDDVRGLFVGDNFYVISQNTLQVFDIQTFLQINKIEF